METFLFTLVVGLGVAVLTLTYFVVAAVVLFVIENKAIIIKVILITLVCVTLGLILTQ